MSIAPSRSTSSSTTTASTFFTSAGAAAFGADVPDEEPLELPNLTKPSATAVW